MRCCLANKHFRAYVASEFIFFFSITMILTGLPYYIEVLCELDQTLLLPVVGAIVGLSFFL